jgi:hypothetical protein
LKSLNELENPTGSPSDPRPSDPPPVRRSFPTDFFVFCEGGFGAGAGAGGAGVVEVEVEVVEVWVEEEERV